MDRDFMGFSFDGIHSSELGITRVSGGDRYEEQLHPEITDITAEVPGMDGEYYFGSTYGTKTIDLEIAFDSLTEKQFRELRRVFGTKGIKQLIFDERPYKYYMAKIESPIELSYICFDERKRTVGAVRDGIRRTTRIEEEPVIDEETGEPIIDEETDEPITESVVYRDLEQVIPYEYQEGTERIYKGEGQISFICYFPFAKSVFKELPSEDEESSWVISSGILSAETRNKYHLDSILTSQTTVSGTNLTYSIPEGYDGIIPVYNPGDMIAKPLIYVPFNNATSYDIDLKLSNNLEVLSIKNLKPLNTNGVGEVGFMINMNNGLIEGISTYTIAADGNKLWVTSGNLYNQYIATGHFFGIPSTEWDGANLPLCIDVKVNNINAQAIDIIYNYLYL